MLLLVLTCFYVVDFPLAASWRLLAVSRMERVALLGGGSYWGTILVALILTTDSSRLHAHGRMVQRMRLQKDEGIPEIDQFRSRLLISDVPS